MPRLSAITPLVSVEDVDRMAAFFRDVLGFTVHIQREGYAYVARDNAALRLSSTMPGGGAQACYIDVEGIDALYAELKPRLDLLPPGRVVPPHDQPYGQREFQVTDEGALQILFGEPAEGRDR